ECQHRVRLAATKVSLELYHRVAAVARDAAYCPNEQAFEAICQERAPEKLNRILVFVRPLTQMHLPEIGGKLSLLIPSAGNVLMRRDNFPPGLEISRYRALDGRTCGLALFSSHLLVKTQSQKLHLHLFDFFRLRR